MRNRLLSGFWRLMLAVPPVLWQGQIAKARRRLSASQSFMTPAHRAVHHYVVGALPRRGSPLPAAQVAAALDLPTDRTVDLLTDLEKRLTYLVRNAEGEVVWAYPVTVEPTPHRIDFSTGERLYAA